MDDLFRLFPDLPRTRHESTAHAVFSDQVQRVERVRQLARLNAARQKAAAERTRADVELSRTRIARPRA